MLRFLKKASAALLFISVSLIGTAQLQITPQSNALALAQKLVGDGIIISNVTITGSPLSTGFFKNISGTQIGLDSGIVLSTGRVQTSGFSYGLDGPQSNLASNTLNTNGDAQLSALVNNQVTYDAAVLEFDFVPVGDTVKFRYVFSSDEYPVFTCSNYNDVFAFFLSGPGIVGSKNLALVPGTNIPVAINSINDGTSPDIGTCNAMGPGSPFTQYFIDNSGNPYFTLNGHTTILTAQSIVAPCQTYHLKIAISDVFDHLYDSGVFIEAKSLISTPLQIINGNPTSNGTPYLVEGCSAGSIKISRLKKLSTPQTVNLFFGGTAVNGTDVQLIPSTAVIPANDSIITIPITPVADNILEGIEKLKIYVAYSTCGVASNVFADSISIDIRDQLSASAATVPASCTAATGSITINIPSSSGAPPYLYALNGGSFQTPNVFSGLTAGAYTLNVKDNSGCNYNFTAIIGLVNNLMVIALPSDTAVCQGGSFTPRVISSGGTGVTYSWAPVAGLSSSTVIQPVITANNSAQYIITAAQGGCFAKDTINLTVFPGASVNAGPDQTIIAGDVIQLQGAGSAGSYLWTPSAGLSATNILNPNASPTQTTTYSLKVTTGQGCTGSDDVVITVVPYCVKPMEAFTPNGDGINDLWLVTNGNCLSRAKAEVFNRYGNKVFQSDDYKNNWDGTYKGKALPDGTYYFIITYQLINGKAVYLKGNVTILR